MTEYLELLGLEEPNQFIVDEIIDRALNYMRRDEIPTELERVIARAIYNAHKRFEAEVEGTANISTLNDGQQQV